jgi:hypothetical protein
MESTPPDSPAPGRPGPVLWGVLTATADGWVPVGPLGTQDDAVAAEALGTALGSGTATSTCTLRRDRAAGLAEALAAAAPSSPLADALGALAPQGPNVVAVFVDRLDDPVSSDADATLRRLAAESLGLRAAPPVREDVRPVE